MIYGFINRYDHGANTEEKNNGYVVFKLNIHGSAGKGWRRGGVLSPTLYRGFWTDI
jgi:hypothetical protein